MAKKKPGTDAGDDDDRHLPSFIARLPAAYGPPLDELVRRSPGSKRTHFVRDAVREFLERRGLWPPKETG